MEVFIIALSKDQIVVWLATFKRESREQIFMLAIPYGRLKDFSKRLESLYAKKVRGNRLDHLDATFLDATCAPFVLEYTSSVFRISDLAGFGATFPSKANLAQTHAFLHAANFLKEKFMDCQFMIRYDVKSFRSSTINNWLKKNTLNAQLDPIDLEASLELQTATLFAALLAEDCNNQDLDLQIQEMIKKLNANIAMSPKWQSLDRSALYLELFNPKWADLLKPIFKQAPRLMDEGLVEKWLKKQINAEYLKTVLNCLELDEGIDLVLSTSINRLPIEYEKQLEKREQEQYKYDEDEFEHWLELYDQVAKTQIHESVDLGLNKWRQSIEQSMANWIENPCLHRQAKTIYLVAQDEKVAYFCFDSVNYTNQLFEQYQHLDSPEQSNLNKEMLLSRLQNAIVFKTGYLKDLEEVLANYSTQSILPNLYCSLSMYHLVMKIELLHNRFIPCYIVNQQQRSWIHQIKEAIYPHCFEEMNHKKDDLNEINDCDEVIERPNLEEEQTDNQSEKRVHVYPQPTKKWFKPAIYQKIDVEQLKSLAKSNLSFYQIRLVGQALAKGLQPKLLQKVLTHPDWTEEIVMPYLLNSRKQKWLKQKWETEGKMMDSFYLNPTWSVAKLEAISKLVDAGLDEQWLKTNLKGNVTLKQIEQLATIYPYGKLPRHYATIISIPTSVQHWLIEQASQKHPELTKDELDLYLALWNEHLFQEVFELQP